MRLYERIAANPNYLGHVYLACIAQFNFHTMRGWLCGSSTWRER